jgi:hypothetical protein
MRRLDRVMPSRPDCLQPVGDSCSRVYVLYLALMPHIRLSHRHCSTQHGEVELGCVCKSITPGHPTIGFVNLLPMKL